MTTEPNLENHKGNPCPYVKGFVFCQEGFCSGCVLYRDWQAKWRDIESEMGYEAGR